MRELTTCFGKRVCLAVDLIVLCAIIGLGAKAQPVYAAGNSGSYFAYGTSFDPSAEALSLTAATSAAPPEENEPFEAGSKLRLQSGRLAVRGAIFCTIRENALEPDPNNPLVDVFTGSQRVDGVEAVIQGNISNHWSLLSSYTYMHSETVHSVAYLLAVGKPLNNMPENLFILWTEYRLFNRLNLGMGSNFVGERTGNTVTLAPGQEIERAPGYLTFNAMARYALTERVSIQANIYNLTDRYYFNQVASDRVTPGSVASALLGVRYHF